ncbi:MAG: hypothetical protein KBD01_00970 [Acidobacteria bacterium]|nr:hypothetical protein [Acidobacteriota bacterium]
MVLDLAGYPIAVELPEGDMAARAAERYRGFIAPPGAPAAFRLAIRIDRAARPANFHPVHVDNPPVRSAGDLDSARVGGDGFDGELDWTAGAGRAVIPDSLAHLDLFVRIALGVALLRAGDTLLHASAVVRDHFAIAFAGPSGAGKSTIAAICAAGGLPVLADEMIAVHHAGLGTRVAGTPFWNGAPRSAPAGALMFLAHAPAPTLTRITADRALPRLLAAGGAPLGLPAVQQAFFAACAALLRRVPAYVLEFAPDPGFWAAVDRLPEFGYFRPRGAALPARLPALAARKEQHR